MDETVDIVDENDNIIGQGLKSMCHKNGTLHRGSNIFVFKDRSFREILLQKRSNNKGSQPSLYCTPGGHVEAGETYLEGAKREFFEEQFNTDVNDELHFEELFKVKKYSDNDHEYVKVFRTICDGPFTPDPHEVETSFFEDIHSLLEHIDKEPGNYTRTTIILLKEYQKRIL